jgi:predicted  nucleic acid-binding Zn-ribbon protein
MNTKKNEHIPAEEMEQDILEVCQEVDEKIEAGLEEVKSKWAKLKNKTKKEWNKIIDNLHQEIKTIRQKSDKKTEITLLNVVDRKEYFVVTYNMNYPVKTKRTIFGKNKIIFTTKKKIQVVQEIQKNE